MLEEEKRTFAGFGSSFYWAITTVIGSGDASYVSSPGGFIIGWLLAFFGVAIVAAMTGAVVGFVIDFLLKEGQGMGAAGYRDHIVVCGWNATARDLIEELQGRRVQDQGRAAPRRRPQPCRRWRLLRPGRHHQHRRPRARRDPRGQLGHRLPGRSLQRGRHALDPGGDGDRVDRAGTCAPSSRPTTPRTSDHFRRAEADEILVTSRLASRLLARSALYPGLSELVTDIVSGGEGSELYRVALPDAYAGLIDRRAVAAARRAPCNAARGLARRPSHDNPPADFRLQPGDDAVVVAEGLGELRPLELQHE